MNTINNRFHDNFTTVMVAFLYSLLALNTLTRAENESLTYIGDLSILLTFFVMTLFLFKTFVDRPQYKVSLFGIYSALILLFILFFISFLKTEYMTEVGDFLKLSFLLVFILASIRMTWSKSHLKISGYIIAIATLLFFYDWMKSGFQVAGFLSIYINENFLAAILFSFLYFNIISLKFSSKLWRGFFLIILFINLLLIAVTSARSILIAIMVITIVWIILKVYPSIFSKLFYIIMIGNFLFIGFYIWLSHVWLGEVLNDLSRSIFNKNLFSGRTEIWSGVIKKIVDKPLFGHGLGVKSSHLIDTELTTHNMYLQVLLEFGIIGLIIFLFLLIMIWRSLTKGLDHFVGRLSACFMLSILIYLSLEVTLFQNNYTIAFFQWLIMTIGISYKEEHEI